MRGTFFLIGLSLGSAARCCLVGSLLSAAAVEADKSQPPPLAAPAAVFSSLFSSHGLEVIESTVWPSSTVAHANGLAAQRAAVVFCSAQIPPVVSVFAESVPVVDDDQIIVQRHLYTAAIDPVKRQPAWVAFTVERQHWDTNNVLSRNFRTPKNLQAVALEQADYAGSSYEMGHLYGLQFVAADDYAAEVNEMQVIAAQRPGLNKGPWLAAENRIKKSSEQQPVKVLAGLLWVDAMPALPQADEPHQIASHCWMIFKPGPDGTEEAYRIPQSCSRSDSLAQFATDPAALRYEVSEAWTKTTGGHE